MAYAPPSLNATSRGDAKYDTRNTWWDPNANAFTDGYWHYPEQGQYVLSNDRPNVNVSGLPGQDEYNERTGTYGSGGGGGGGGGFTPAGVYQLDAAKAKLAYDRAVAAADTGIKNLNQNIGVQNLNGKFQIDPHNEFGLLRGLIGQVGGTMNDAYDAASERHIGHKGLGAQGVTLARQIGSNQIANLGNQYSQQYQKFLTSKSDALAEYNLAKQMAEYYANMQGSYWSGGGGGYDPGGSPEDVARRQQQMTAPAYNNQQYRVGQVQPSGYAINTGGGFYTNQQNNELTNKWKRLAGIA